MFSLIILKHTMVIKYVMKVDNILILDLITKIGYQKACRHFYSKG